MLMIKITHIVNPHLMWWKFVDDFLGVKLVEHTEKKVNTYMSQLRKGQEKEGTFEIGDYVAVYYIRWQKYVRGRVRKVYNHGAADGAYIVWLVDHGFPIRTSHTCVHRLPKGELQNEIVFIYRGGIANLQLNKLAVDVKAATESSKTLQFCCGVCKVMRSVLKNNLHCVYAEVLYVDEVTKHHWCHMEVEILEKTLNVMQILTTLKLGTDVSLAEFRRVSGKLQTLHATPWLKCNGMDNFHKNTATVEKTSGHTLNTCARSTQLKVKNWLNQSALLKEIASNTLKETVNEDKTVQPTPDPNACATHQPQLQTGTRNALELAHDREIERDSQEGEAAEDNLDVTLMENLHMNSSTTIEESLHSDVKTEVKSEEHTGMLLQPTLSDRKVETCLSQKMNPRWVELKCGVLTHVSLGDETDWTNIHLQLVGKDYVSKLNALDSYIQEEMVNLKPAQESSLELGGNYVARYEGNYHRAQLYRICTSAELRFYQFFLVDLATIVDVVDEDIGRGEVFESTPEIVNFTEFQAVHCTLVGIHLNTRIDCELSTKAHLYVSASFNDMKVVNFLNINSYKVVLFVCDEEKDFDVNEAPIQGVMLNKVLIDYKYAERESTTELYLNMKFGLKENPILPQENTSLYNFEIISTGNNF